MNIRRLQENDAEAFRELRTRALREHPEAFGESVEGFLARPLEQLRETLGSPSEDLFALGAFNDELKGFLMFHRPPLERTKTRHRAHVAAMYVVPEARGQGLAKALLTELIKQAKSFEGLEYLVLGVTMSNISAIRLYESLGFKSYAVDPKFIKLEDKYFDTALMMLELH